MKTFKRNRKFYCLLTKVKEDYWVSDIPLFIDGNQGLFPVFKAGGPTGQFPKNHQELILKQIGGKNDTTHGLW